MALFLKEIGLTADRPLKTDELAVENMSRVVCALLVDGLKRKVATTFWKLSIRINSSDLSDNGKILLGVLIVNRNFPTAEFLQSRLKDRQSLMLGFVSGVLRDVLLDANLDASPVEDAVKYVLDKKLCNVIVGKKRFIDPTTSEVAHIKCEQEMDEARIYVVFIEKGRQAREVLVATSVPEEFIFQSFFGRVEWDEESHPSLLKVDGSTIAVIKEHGR